MLTQPYVIRLTYKTELDTEKAHAELENMGVFGDFVRTDGKWRLVFTDTSMIIAKSYIKRLGNKPYFTEVFDTSDLPQEGWPQFKQLQDS